MLIVFAVMLLPVKNFPIKKKALGQLGKKTSAVVNVGEVMIRVNVMNQASVRELVNNTMTFDQNLFHTCFMLHYASHNPYSLHSCTNFNFRT